MKAELCYNMNHSKRGAFVIFCYSKIRVDKEQSNANKKVYKTDVSFYEDVKYLEKLAHLMGFKHEDIVLFDSLTYSETEQALVYVTEEVQKAGKDQDCFVCAILSHGMENGIVATKDKPISIDNFTYLFSKSCPVLVGKPKILIKISCMGSEPIGKNIINSKNIRNRNNALENYNKQTKYLSKALANITEKFSFFDFKENSSQIFKPMNEDFLIYYSTVEGFVTCVHVVKNESKWFLAKNSCQYSVHALVNLFSIHGFEKDFLQVLTDTCYLVTKYSKPALNKYMNTPSIENQLSKKLYFTKAKSAEEGSLNRTLNGKAEQFQLNLHKRLSQFIVLNGPLTSCEEIITNLEKKFYVSSRIKSLYEHLKEDTQGSERKGFSLRKRINA